MIYQARLNESKTRWVVWNTEKNWCVDFIGWPLDREGDCKSVVRRMNESCQSEKACREAQSQKQVNEDAPPAGIFLDGTELDLLAADESDYAGE
jgi:hypothetical protein